MSADIPQIAGFLSRHFTRHSPDRRLFWGIFRPVEVLCKKIQSVAGCAGGQIVGLAAAKSWSASRGLHQGIPRPSASAFAPVAPSCPRRRCTQSGDQRRDHARSWEVITPPLLSACGRRWRAGSRDGDGGRRARACRSARPCARRGRAAPSACSSAPAAPWPCARLDFPPGAGGFANEPGTPGGKDGGEANPTELHEGVQGAGGEAVAGRRQGAVGGGDGAWHWHRAAQPVAHRAPGGRLGRGTGRPQGGAGGNAATEARGEAARRGGGDPPQGGGFFRQGDRVTKFAFVSAERANHAVTTLCRVIGASVSGFYAWLHAIPTVQSRAEAEAERGEKIGRVFAARRRVYGAPRVHAELRREGLRHSRRRVARLMRERGLSARRGRRRTPRTTDSRHNLPVAPNLLARNVTADRPDQVWLADISYIPI